MLALTTGVRRFKSARKLGLGAPLARLTIAIDDAALRDALERAGPDLRSVTRVAEIAWSAATGMGFEEVAPGVGLSIEL